MFPEYLGEENILNEDYVMSFIGKADDDELIELAKVMVEDDSDPAQPPGVGESLPWQFKRSRLIPRDH